MCKVREFNSPHMKEVKEELLAKDIKKLFTNFLQNKFPIEGLGYEIMYGTSRRVVDMLAIIRGRTYAIEIKSAGFAFAHPATHGSRIAPIAKMDNAESPRMAYINPIRRRPYISGSLWHGIIYLP